MLGGACWYLMAPTDEGHGLREEERRFFVPRQMLFLREHLLLEKALKGEGEGRAPARPHFPGVCAFPEIRERADRVPQRRFRGPRFSRPLLIPSSSSAFILSSPSHADPPSPCSLVFPSRSPLRRRGARFDDGIGLANEKLSFILRRTWPPARCTDSSAVVRTSSPLIP